MTKSKILMGASALVSVSVALAGGALAAPSTQIFGAGSTLIGPYLRQVEDCYGSPTPLVYQGAVPYAAGSETYSGSSLNVAGGATLPPINPYFYAGTVPFNCGTSHVDASTQLNYANTGSGNGQLGAMTHDVALDIGTTTEAGAPASTLAYTGVQYGMGDYGIGANDVDAFTNGSGTGAGGAGNNLLGQKTGAGLIVAIQPTTVVADATHIVYGNGATQYGNFIQFPVSVDPVAIAYNPVYKETTDAAGNVNHQYKFKLHKANADASGGLLLDVATVCAIFNGQITLWSDPALQALNGGVSLKDPTDTGTEFATLPINLFGRADSSGTTSIIYRALAAQCNPTSSGYAGTNYYAAAGGKKLPSNLLKPAGAQAIFTVATGTSAVAALIGTTPATGPASSTILLGNMGYLGTDYVLPAVISTGANTYGINVADIKLPAAPTGVEPLAKNAILAFGTGTNALLPPQSTSAGAFTLTPPANSLGLRSHPEDWAEPLATTVSFEGGPAVNTPLADPNHNVALVTKAYPFVGTTNMFLDTCYNDATVTTNLKAFITYLETNLLVIDTSATHPGVLVKAGLNPLPKAWLTAIKATFVTPVTKGATETDQLNLNILQAGTGPVSGKGSQCNAVTPGA